LHTQGIKQEWPNTSVALIGMRWNPQPDSWNKEVLFSPAARIADAVTLHIYCGWDADANSTAPDNLALHLAVAAMRAHNNGDTAAAFPAHLRVWVTEMGVYPAGRLDGTWLHALFYAAMDLLLPATVPTLDILTPYCFLCADPTAPSFTTTEYGPVVPPAAAGTVPIVRRLTGEVQAQIFLAMQHASSIAPLVFSPNPVLHPSENRSRTFLGWQVAGPSPTVGVILNQGCAAADVDVGLLAWASPSRIGVQPATLQVNCTFPRSVEDVVRTGMDVADLGRSTVTFGGSVARLPAYSLCLVHRLTKAADCNQSICGHSTWTQ